MTPRSTARETSEGSRWRLVTCLLLLVFLPGLTYLAAQESPALARRSAESPLRGARRVNWAPLPRATLWLLRPTIRQLGLVWSRKLDEGERHFGLGEGFEEKARGTLFLAMEHGSGEEKAAAALALSRLGDDEHLPCVLEALKGADHEPAELLILSLGVGGHERSRGYLESLARDGLIGRNLLGTTEQPVHPDHRAAAVLALGFLESAADRDVPADFVLRPKDLPARVHLAAIVALGVRDRKLTTLKDGAEMRGDPRRFPYGPPLRVPSPAENAADACLGMIEQELISDAASSALLMTLTRVAPDNLKVQSLARRSISSPDPLIARAAILSSAWLGKVYEPTTSSVLRRRVKDLSDTQAAGLALLALGEFLDEENQAALREGLRGPECLRTYALWSLVLQGGSTGFDQKAIESDLIEGFDQWSRAAADKDTWCVDLVRHVFDPVLDDAGSGTCIPGHLSFASRESSLMSGTPGEVARWAVIRDSETRCLALLKALVDLNVPGRDRAHLLSALGILLEPVDQPRLSRLQGVVASGAEWPLLRRVSALE